MSDEVSRNPIIGKAAQIVRLDEQGKPIGEPVEVHGLDFTLDTGEPVEDVDFPFKTWTREITLMPINVELMALVTGEAWRLDPMYQEMGAWAKFDYAGENSEFNARLTRCYELVGIGATLSGDRVTVPEFLPYPAHVVHGVWSSPETRDRPIPHAWLEMSDGSVWEPISALLYNPHQFYDYTLGERTSVYTIREAVLNMLTRGHFGVWDR